MATKVIIVKSVFDLAERLRHELKDSKAIGVEMFKDDGSRVSRVVTHPSYNPPKGTKKRGKKEGDIGLVNVRDITKANAIYSAFKNYKCGAEMTPLPKGILERSRIQFHEGMTMEHLKEIVPKKTWTRIRLSNLLSVTAEGVKYSL